MQTDLFFRANVSIKVILQIRRVIDVMGKGRIRTGERFTTISELSLLTYRLITMEIQLHRGSGVLKRSEDKGSDIPFTLRN